jgi:hypothetical protein
VRWLIENQQIMEQEIKYNKLNLTMLLWHVLLNRTAAYWTLYTRCDCNLNESKKQFQTYWCCLNSRWWSSSSLLFCELTLHLGYKKVCDEPMKHTYSGTHI